MIARKNNAAPLVLLTGQSKADRFYGGADTLSSREAWKEAT